MMNKICFILIKQLMLCLVVQKKYLLFQIISNELCDAAKVTIVVRDRRGKWLVTQRANCCVVCHLDNPKPSFCFGLGNAGLVEALASSAVVEI